MPRCVLKKSLNFFLSSPEKPYCGLFGELTALDGVLYAFWHVKFLGGYSFCRVQRCLLRFQKWCSMFYQDYQGVPKILPHLEPHELLSLQVLSTECNVIVAADIALLSCAIFNKVQSCTRYNFFLLQCRHRWNCGFNKNASILFSFLDYIIFIILLTYFIIILTT